MSKKTTNIFTKGLDLSTDPINQAKDTYSYGLNGIKENIINNPEVVINEKGFTEYIDLDYEYILLGTRYLGKKDYVLFIKNIEGQSVFHRILLMEDGVITRTILDRTDMGFSNSHPIISTYRLNYKNQRIIYWVDGLNDDRVINIDIDTSAYDVTLFSINSSANKPLLEATVLDTGGRLISGQYFIAISYNIGDTYTTQPLIVSKPISIAAEDYYNDTPYTESIYKLFGQTDGDIIPNPTRKSLRINTTSLDPNFDTYNIIVLRQEETFNVIRVIKNIELEQTEYIFTGDEGELDETMTLADIIINPVEYYASEAITQKNNRLLRANSKLKTNNIDYQSFANNIVVRYKINEKLVYDLNVVNGYKTDNKADGGSYDAVLNVAKKHSISPSYLANTANNEEDNKSFMRDEVYSLGIGFELVDGTETDVYHIAGRAANYFANTPTGVGEYNRTFTPVWDTDTVEGQPRWKVRNTAVKQSGLSELGYWRSSEVYPDDYNYPTNGEQNLSGKSYIRHHKMPSDVIEPIYRTEITGNPNKYKGETTNYKLYKRNIGLDFSNIVIPPNLQGVIKKIKFFYTPRDSSNKYVLSKGITYKINTIDIPNQQSGYLNYEMHTSDQTTKFEFISPEVNFNFKEANLSGATMKVCGIDKGYVNFAGQKELTPNESGNNAYYIRTFNSQLYYDTGRQQSIISAFCFYNQRAIPKEDIYSRALNKLIYVDGNFRGTTEIGDLNFMGSQNTAILEIVEPITLKPTPVAIPLANYYPELLYPTSSDVSNQLYRNVIQYYPVEQGGSSSDVALYRLSRRLLEEKSWADNLYYDTAFYVQICNNKTNLYGSINSLKFVDAGTIEYTTGNIVSATINGGDTIIDVHHFKQSKIIPQSRVDDSIPIALNVNGGYSTVHALEPSNLLVEIYENATQSFGSFFCESDINFRMRREGDGNDEKYFPKSYYNLSNLNNISGHIDNKEFYKIETPYNNQYIKPYFIFYIKNDELQEIINDDVRYYSRIIYSEKQSLEDKADNYRKFKANNYRDLPLDKGGISILFINQEKLYAITRDTIFNVFTSNQNLQSLNETIVSVGTGEFLGTEPIDLLSIDGGFAGTTSKLSFVESPYGYLFVDRYKGRIILFNNETNEISVKDIVAFFRENFEITAIKALGLEDDAFDEPLNNFGYTCGFDAELNRFLITKLDFILTSAGLTSYVGIFDPEASYEPGDIYFKDGRLYIVSSSTTDQWITIIDTTNLSDFTPGEVLPIEYGYIEPTNGSIIDNLNGTITYTPNTDYVGEDSFIITSNCITEPIEIDTLYGNDELMQAFFRNNCDEGTEGTEVEYIVYQNTYFDLTQLGANALAQADIDTNGQNYANVNGYCNLLTVGNQIQGSIFTRDNCVEPLIGTTVEYVVAADTYFANTLEEANTLALLDVANNGQEYANTNGTCEEEIFWNTEQSDVFTKNDCTGGSTPIGTVTVTVPEHTFSAATQIAADSLAIAFIVDNGQGIANEEGVCTVGNTERCGIFYSEECGSETPVAYNFCIAANIYFANTLAEANALRDADFNTLGQADANANGICSPLIGNELQCEEFLREDCPEGSTADPYNYCVPMNTYFAETLIEANNLALVDIAANGQTEANTNGDCNPTEYSPRWVADGSTEYCIETEPPAAFKWILDDLEYCETTD